MRLELPIFTVENPNGWSAFSTSKNIPKLSGWKPRLSPLKGMPFSGINGRIRGSILSWTELHGLLLKQFRATMEGSLHEQWMDLKQNSTIAKNRRQFIARAAPLEEVSEVCFINKFVSGLRLEIQKELRLLGPVGLG